MANASSFVDSLFEDRRVVMRIVSHWHARNLYEDAGTLGNVFYLFMCDALYGATDLSVDNVGVNLFRNPNYCIPFGLLSRRSSRLLQRLLEQYDTLFGTREIVRGSHIRLSDYTGEDARDLLSASARQRIVKGFASIILYRRTELGLYYALVSACQRLIHADAKRESGGNNFTISLHNAVQGLCHIRDI